MACAKFVFVRAEFLRLIVGHKARNLTANTRNKPDDRTCYRANADCALIAKQFRDRALDRMLLHLDSFGAIVFAALGEHGDHLRYGKQPNQCSDDVNTATQRWMEYETLCSHDVIKTNRRKPQTYTA